MENIHLPTRISLEQGEQPHTAILTVEPCYWGYGTTLGNALRRVLLSTLPGAAVTAVKIKGATHEFQAIPQVKEDALQVILNMKSLRLKLHSDQPIKLQLRKKGEGAVTAGDFEPNADVEILNPDLHIATITEAKGEFELEAVIERGRGYSATEERKNNVDEIGMIAIDALFSPIRNVGYRVENVRVGDITNFDKLVMMIETDGTVDPQEAIKQSAKILIDHFRLLTGDSEVINPAPESTEAPLA